MKSGVSLKYVKHQDSRDIWNGSVHGIFVGLTAPSLEVTKISERQSFKYFLFSRVSQREFGTKPELPEGVPNQVLYGEASPRGPIPYPFIYYFW